MATPVLAVGAGVLALPMVAVAVFFGSGAADPPPAGDSVCTVVTDLAADGTSGAGTTQLTGKQVENARVILAAAKTLAMPQQAAAVGVMTAYQESALLVLANPAVPESLDYPHQGEGSDHDSVGTFQQRPSMGWGTVGQLMNPGYAATAFLLALAEVPGWQTLPAWQAAQQVQASADGTLYAQWEPLATALTSALWDGVTGTLQCTATGGPISGPGGTFPPEACSVRPDPTTDRGCLTPRMLNIATQLMAQGYQLSCWDEHAWNPASDHPRGKACDVFFGPGGYAEGEDKARGDALNATLQASAAQTGLAYTIWYGIYYQVGAAPKTYCSDVYGCPPTDANGGHYNHVHVSVL